MTRADAAALGEHASIMPLSVAAACEQRRLSLSRSMEALGVMFGEDAVIEAQCAEAVHSSEAFFAALTHPELPTQMAFSLLRSCGIPRLGFLARTTHPDGLSTAALRFDEQALNTLLQLMQWSDTSLTALQLQAESEEQKE